MQDPSHKRLRRNDDDAEQLALEQETAAAADKDCECNQCDDGTGGMSFNLWPRRGEGAAGAPSEVDINNIDMCDLLLMGSSTCIDDEGIYTGCVSEIYSPPKIAPVAHAAGFEKGSSMDLTTRDPEGRAWDFSDATQRKRAKRLINQQKSLLIVGSPMCRMFSSLGCC